MAEENGHHKPFPNSHPTDDVKTDGKCQLQPPSPFHIKRNRRRCFFLCSCCVALLVIVAVILVVLAFTVFKVRGPEMRLNSIKIQQNITLANVSVVVDVSVKNPNPVAYYFDDSTTSFYYQGLRFGLAQGPPGMAKGHTTYRSNLTVTVPAGKLVSLIAGGLNSNIVPIDSATIVQGHVKILGLVRHHVDVGMNCSVKVAILNLTILYQSCWQHIWI